MKGYKAFSKGLVCRGKQYAENTVFEEAEAKICESGMHFCKNPLDTLDYYPLIDDNGDLTEFAEVEALDKAITDDGKKYCTKKLKVHAKLDLLSFVRASVDVMRETITEQADKKNGNYAKLAGGNDAKLVGGYCAQLAGGNDAQLAGGNDAQLAGGNRAQLAGGNRAQLAGGNYAKLAGGNDAQLAGGANAVMVGDHGSVAKGKRGSVIVLVERGDDGNITAYKAGMVGGDTLKEDVFYKLEHGEFVVADKEAIEPNE